MNRKIEIEIETKIKIENPIDRVTWNRLTPCRFMGAAWLHPADGQAGMATGKLQAGARLRPAAQAKASGFGPEPGPAGEAQVLQQALNGSSRSRISG
jgi:hypothetical protein